MIRPGIKPGLFFVCLYPDTRHNNQDAIEPDTKEWFCFLTLKSFLAFDDFFRGLVSFLEYQQADLKQLLRIPRPQEDVRRMRVFGYAFSDFLAENEAVTFAI